MTTVIEIPPDVTDEERGRWDILLTVDKFDLDAIDRVRRHLDPLQLNGPDWEPELGSDEGRAALELLGIAPVETVLLPHNLLTRQGRKRLIDRLVGTASNQAMDATHLRIGVGNGVTAAADTDTDLVAAAGSANRQFKLVGTGPTVGSGASSGQISAVATFLTSEANFAWAEWGFDGGTADGTTVTTEGNTTPGLFNRRVPAGTLGTKTSAGQWVATMTGSIT